MSEDRAPKRTPKTTPTPPAWVKSQNAAIWSAQALADYFGRSLSWVRDRIASGCFNETLTVGGSRYVTDKALAEYLESCRDEDPRAPLFTD